MRDLRDSPTLLFRSVPPVAMQHLFLSPHFDDVVGSCGGTIARLRDAGAAVRIHTVFGGDPQQPLPPPAVEMHRLWNLGDEPVRRRRAEDAEACRRLGVLATAGSSRDALYRCSPDGHPLYPTEGARVGAIHPLDRPIAARLARALRERPEAARTRHYFPLAIGGHVDHRILARAGTIAHALGLRTAFYEDFWYRDRTPWRPVPGTRAVMFRFSADHSRRKIEALAAYRSQIASLYEDDAAMVQAMRRADGLPGEEGFAERYWLLRRIGSAAPK